MRTYAQIRLGVLGTLCAVLWWPGAAVAEVRQAQAAGKFYPDEQIELVEAVNDFLNDQDPPAHADKPRILISPHAGYPYSGIVAGAAFRQVKGQAYDGVVVVGFTHRLQFHGASVDTRDAYETPLGTVPVDTAAADFLRSQPGLSFHEEAHGTGEHSLEVMLPFLQVALEKPRLVPVMMGGASFAEADQLAAALAKLSARGDYLFVFSTDLSHYHPNADAERIDEDTINAVLYETPQAVARLFADASIEACGRGPIVTSLLLAERLGFLRREQLRYGTSADTAGNAASVVGYGAIGMYPAGPAPAAVKLSETAGQVMVRAARRAIEAAVQAPSAGAPEDLARYPELSQAHGVFVTLRQGAALRGCIGTIVTAEPLSAVLPKMAVEAATRDPRFPPVRPEELPGLTVEVSVLSLPHRVAGPDDIIPGRDGVVLESKGRSGVFLPSVWQESAWTRDEFLDELATQKAGLPASAWREGAALSVFQDQAFAEPEVQAPAH